jgi:DNA-binding response OmpR family regulator
MPRLILVVDDDPHSRDILRTYLEARGYAVVTARDGREALSLVDRIRPALVLLDVMMPGIDGWEVARRMREHPDFGAARILMLTARTDRLTDGPADDLVHKPVLLEELARRIERVLQPHEPAG